MLPKLRLAFHLDFSLGFDFKLSLDLRLQFEDCRAQRVVDADPRWRTFAR